MGRKSLGDASSELCFGKPCETYEHLARGQLGMSVEFSAEVRAIHTSHWHKETGR